MPPASDAPLRRMEAKLKSIMTGRAGDNPAQFGRSVRDIMTEKAGVFREGKELEQAISEIMDFKERFPRIRLEQAPLAFNYELVEYLDVASILDLCEIIAKGALRRTESRGAHFRTDFPTRDDANWLAHTYAQYSQDGPVLTNGPVNITKYQPAARGY